MSVVLPAWKVFKEETECYKNGTYTIPPVVGYVPFGTSERFLFPCSGCTENAYITKWISHTVNRSRENPDRNGSYGNYNQISYYCDQCYPVMEKLAKEIPLKNSLEKIVEIASDKTLETKVALQRISEIASSYKPESENLSWKRNSTGAVIMDWESMEPPGNND